MVFGMMKRVDSFFSLFLIFCAFATASERFPLPENLKTNVEFWEKIYSQYPDSCALIHDKDRLDIIYKVVYLDDGQQSWKKVEEEKDRILDVLNSLSRRMPDIDTLALNDEERFIYRLWLDTDDPHKFRKAGYNIRGQLGLANRFREGLVRSGQYLENIQNILRQYDLPVELAYLPHVESSFNHKAYSKVGAAGMWQFTRSTGRLFLKINYELDERYDPHLSTIAAAKLLKKNYEELGVWPLAITAYNHGLYGMKRAIARTGTDDIGQIVEQYKSRRFGFASKNFYSEFLAAKNVAENYENYFGDFKLAKALNYELYELPHFVTLKSVIRAFRVDIDTLIALNPAFRIPIIKSQRRIPKGYKLRLPLRHNMDVDDLYSRLNPAHKYHHQIRDRYYTVRSGDNLSAIARRYNTSTHHLMAMNDLANPHFIRAGQILELPGSEKSINAPVEKEEMLGGGLKSHQKIAHTDVPEQETVQDTILRKFQSFSFKVHFTVPSDNYINVQPEETLGHYADWLQINTQRLRDANSLLFGQDIQVGQRIRLIFTRVAAKQFHRRRLEYHKSIQEDFFNNYKVKGVRHYSIQSGDNLWRICNQQFEIPCWLLAQYNPDKKISKLYPGDKLTVPIISTLTNTGNE
jgi:membrane-bound lytic murein transglycosylase D